MRIVIIAATLLALTGCGQSSEMQAKQAESRPTMDLATMDVAEPTATAPGIAASESPATNPAPIAVAVPQMAYSYKYGFRLDGDAIARAFGRQLQAAVAKAGGRAVSSSIAGEDVSKSIVDTEARLRQRTLLVERLTEILRTRTGNVAELVEAERSVAAAQEEIDQAKGWLAELRGRVAMATVEIDYQAVATEATPQGSALGDAVAQSMAMFVSGIGTLIALLIFLLPWTVIAGLIWLGWRRWRQRRDTDPI